MIKITDRYKLDAEEIKRALMEQTDEYRQLFDQTLTKKDITEEQRLKALEVCSTSCAAILTFIYTKAGIDLRTEDGMMLSHQGYFMAKIFDVKQRIKKSSQAV